MLKNLRTYGIMLTQNIVSAVLFKEVENVKTRLQKQLYCGTLFAT